MTSVISLGSPDSNVVTTALMANAITAALSVYAHVGRWPWFSDIAPSLSGLSCLKRGEMADRTVKVRITAQVQEYIEDMEKAARATRETGSAAEKLAQQRDAFTLMGTAALAMGAAAAAGVGLAISKWADFDQAMSNVQAATHESAGNMQLLSDAALDAGARTVFSAEEAANAIEELAKAGVSTADIIGGGLDGALDLAAAGGLGVADAAGIAATALKTFNLQGTDMSHVADLLAAGAGKAMGDVTDLSAALNQSAMVANATGLSIEETTAGLAAFASQGLLGSDAGTSFKSMLQSLTPTSSKAAEAMSDLGISAYDSQGNFVGLAEFAGQLKSSLSELTVEQQQAALKTIFGSDAIRAATVLYSEGEEGIREWTAAVDDQGYAAETAAARLDNLKGDIEALGGALDTALIQTGSGANNVLREMVQGVTAAIDMYNELPAPLQGAALGVGLVTAAAGLLGGGLLVSINKAAEFKLALETLQITSERAGGALAGVGRFLTGPWGVALLGAAAVAAVLVGEKQKLTDKAKELAGTLDGETGAVTENSTAWAANQLQQEGVLSAAKRLGISADDATQAWLGNADALERVNGRLDKWRKNADFRDENAFKGWSDDLVDMDYALDGSNKVLAEAKTRHDELAEATEGSAEASGAASGAAGEQSNALTSLTETTTATEEAISGLVDEIRGFNDVVFDTRSANRALEDSYLTLTESLEANGNNFDISSEAGRQNEAALDAVARATNEAAAATLTQTGSQEEANAKLEEGKQRLIDILAPTYGSRDAAAAYVETLNLISPEKVTQIVANAEQAKADLDTYIGRLNSIPAVVSTEVRQMQALVYKEPASLYAKHANGGIEEYANGGIRDNMRAMAAFAAGGGVDTGIYSGGSPIVKFAEPETGWEAYISGKPDQRDRNRQIWMETGSRLGMDEVLKAVTSRQSGPSGAQVNMTVHPTRGMSEAEVGRIAADKIKFGLGG